MYDTYVSIDLETTGLNPKRDRIIEIGAIRVEQGQIVEEFSTFVDPGRKLERTDHRTYGNPGRRPCGCTSAG